MIAATRVALGMGGGLLLAGKLNRDQRRAAGWALIAAGVLTTVPIALEIRGKGQVKEQQPVVLAA